ncbi:rRNA adenine N-6-methyltransferase family protein [Microlunatus parietis]|uniref:16S rRNA (Adenine1518-N6/adenine1519-N6)-dimethyltransferase n=1 Tax=Microlunatus parietis TaxID=682979 RepID=A0A7Y9I890_9ACTN|nr:rRNA adenine N-6-methyltransferase family protein [Microlunatus parietis]NYE72037.1 16S rRNA (adenine1518-N6/adenine1519-N6)-dimethyltransferase [Microlunatus parietis]
MPAHPYPLDPDLDQHLLDPGLAADLVAGAELTRDDVVLDIGAGTGALTAAILRQRPRAVIAVEPDPRCLASLANLPCLDLRAGRIQDIDPASLTAVTMVIANPPFSALHHVIGLARRLPRLRAVELCVGRRWAEAATAGPADPHYSAITLDVSARFSIAVARRVPGSAFTPPIATPAAWLRLVPLARPDPLLLSLADAVRARAGLRLKDWLRSPAANRQPQRDRMLKLRADPFVRGLQQRRLSALTKAELARLVRHLQEGQC